MGLLLAVYYQTIAQCSLTLRLAAAHPMMSSQSEEAEGPSENTGRLNQSSVINIVEMEGRIHGERSHKTA